MAAGSTVHQLKVTLRSVRPPIWRRIIVASDTPLSELAALLEAAMGWMGGHLHAFDAGDVIYEVPDPESIGGGFRRSIDERTVTLAEVLDAPKTKLRWDYDFGDGWEHDLVVEETLPADSQVDYPICVTGRRACPPEDCGGTFGYAELLAALEDPQRDRHDELAEWMPGEFDPEDFDADEATKALHDPRPLEGWFEE